MRLRTPNTVPVMILGIFLGFVLSHMAGALQSGYQNSLLQRTQLELLKWQTASMALQDQVASLEAKLANRPFYEVAVSFVIPGQAEAIPSRIGTAAVSVFLHEKGFTPGKHIYIEGIGVFLVDKVIHHESAAQPREFPPPSLFLCTDNPPETKAEQKRVARVMLLG